jgi:hypothetical protein
MITPLLCERFFRHTLAASQRVPPQLGVIPGVPFRRSAKRMNAGKEETLK